jgi:hypothetical protein
MKLETQEGDGHPIETISHRGKPDFFCLLNLRCSVPGQDSVGGIKTSVDEDEGNWKRMSRKSF